MKLLIATLGVSAMIGFAAPAYGDPDDIGGDDAGFLAALQQDDLGYTNPAQAIASAKAVCTCLSNGESGLELVHDVKTHNPGLDMERASHFAMIAAKYYCPQHLSKA